jgi:hypothetical protein
MGASNGPHFLFISTANLHRVSSRQAEDLQVKCAVMTYFDTVCIVMYR